MLPLLIRLCKEQKEEKEHEKQPNVMKLILWADDRKQERTRRQENERAVNMIIGAT